MIMNEKLAKITRSISLISLSLGLLLTPLFFLPLTTDYFQLQKLVLFILLTAVALTSWLVYNFAVKTVRLTFSPLLLPWVILAALSLVSTIINSPANPEAWASRPTMFAALFIYFVLATTLINSSKIVKKILNGLLAVGVILAIQSLFSVSGAFSSLSLPAYLTAKAFSFTGSPLTAVVFLATLLPVGLVFAFKTKAGPTKLVYFLVSGLLISSLILTGYQLMPKQELAPLLLPKLAGWSIAVDTLKTKPFLGAGPMDFLNQFTQFKPIGLNQTNLWAVNFSSSSNEYLNLLTNFGLLGLAAFLLLIFSWKKLIKRDPGTRTTGNQMAVNWAVVVLLIAALLIPFNTLHWVLLTGLFSLSVGLNKAKNLTKVKDVILTINAITVVEPFELTPVSPAAANTVILPVLLGIPLIISVIISGYKISRVYASEYAFANSLIAADANKGTDTYNLQIKAINLNPNIDRYHIAYSNTNLALASSLSANPPAGGDLTDQDKQTIAQLVQQAVAEARTATQLNPNKSAAWANLANIYRQLINFAQDADQFSIAAYTRAVQLDPANPQLRLEFGSLFYSLKRYDEAVARFQEAAQLKTDFANAYYNLSHAYQDQEKFLEAYQVMQSVISLVPADSADAAKVQEELTNLQTKLPKTTAAETTTPVTEPAAQLTEPSPPPAAPKDFEPVNLEASPSPKP
ncbi:MAG: Peptidase S1 and S6 chymotrypsin/Hap [Candidatus Beckwithbacteria bacterium GW2011_GWA2_43_10]|uniref:Peptidase S1 and S6 chymotrypsin/Hap n=1 Tax=Candidatus Beckwithbacteria bacterium GW2011_GWA2_43_10 TaxID=1618369 RepID=A0A0G1E7G3_9BACT|nr:MAG: Peptidase S1 and S6 chymotrypsin/Hap [Candidatus Beckwithbacteria bacterium GW2011_GWA2_43_10]